jgi:hypothetical protein
VQVIYFAYIFNVNFDVKVGDLQLSAFSFVCMYVCMCVYVYIYIYIYTHAYVFQGLMLCRGDEPSSWVENSYRRDKSIYQLVRLRIFIDIII